MIMTLIRLKDQNTDILITLSSPKRFEAKEDDFKMIKSFKIEDFGLFK